MKKIKTSKKMNKLAEKLFYIFAAVVLVYYINKIFYIIEVQSIYSTISIF